MAGKIIADTLETGAGADISTSYVVNGSAKSWVKLNGNGSDGIFASLNVSSTSDEGTGDFDVTLTSSMDAGNTYATLAGERRSETVNHSMGMTNITATTASQYTIQTTNTAGSSTDFYAMHVSLLGDLA
jgi:hypothetical protein